MRWRMDGAVQQSSMPVRAFLTLGIALTVYPAWFENAARFARDQEDRQ